MHEDPSKTRRRKLRVEQGENLISFHLDRATDGVRRHGMKPDAKAKTLTYLGI